MRRLETQLASERTAHGEELDQCRKHEATTVAAVREEYESTITRHLSFIDQLIADKNDLSSTCTYAWVITASPLRVHFDYDWLNRKV